MTEVVELDLVLVTNNLNTTLANLTTVMAQISANPKPRYRLHGHEYDWPEMYDWLNRQIESTMRQLTRVQPFEIISVAR